MSRGHSPQHQDEDSGVLLYHNPETRETEILVDEHRRGQPDVQADVMRLMSEHTRASPRFVSRSVLQACRQTQDRGAASDEPGLALKDLADVSRRQAEVLGYFQTARQTGSSDIHVTTSPGLTRIEMRIHGDLVTVAELAEQDGEALAATIILSMCDVTEVQFFPMRKQDGRVAAKFLKKVGLFGARYSHTPTADGLHFVMRTINDDGDRVPSLVQLGFLPAQITLIQRILRLPEGMVILSGPTGSGKSTTLRSFSRIWLERTGFLKRLLTVEDPPEGRIAGAIQTPIICDKADEAEVRRAWERAISSALRLDPDAIMPGELRDLISILAGIFAAQTGHLVMSTLHTNSALSIPERMITMGVEAGLILDAQLMVGLISQRLVKTLCPHCKVPWVQKVTSLSDEQRTYLEKYCHEPGLCRPEDLYFRYPEGCEHCRKSVVLNGRTVATVGHGVTGRSVVAEVIRPDARLFHLLKTEGKEVARRYWMESGGITRRTHLLHRLGAGLVDPLEADETIPLDEDDVLQVPEDSGAHAGTRSDGSTATGLSEELKELVSLAVSSGIEQGLARGLQEALKVALTALRQNAAAQRSNNTVNNHNGGGHGQ
ncbi:pilus assembly protein [Salmonella enterica]|nr:pilus assembly protein [Salmonella enterica]EBS3851030.1 pilus assembly protein [Salmonella enterica subsp. enterica serovar Java]EDQ0183672.1 pilus assembly protein [Salmonella enterica subsp. enterica serovar 4,[5],12:b:-]EEE5613307.1 pilus assembly protein [Salmonella enterica subsp. enterica serovar Typhimurium]EKN5804682.1 Flp pilus assembly complex ATPase component TadA [Salmonella enterica subsp. enterica]